MQPPIPSADLLDLSLFAEVRRSTANPRPSEARRHCAGARRPAGPPLPARHATVQSQSAPRHEAHALLGLRRICPGPVFDVRKGQALSVEWVNELPQQHFLPIDHTLHGAEAGKPQVRTVVHLHGARVPPESDGYPEHWIVPGQSAVHFIRIIRTLPRSFITRRHGDHAAQHRRRIIRLISDS